MTKPSINDYIAWGLTHADRWSVPDGALLPVPISSVGTDPWHYLYGSTRVQTTADTIDYYWRSHYWRKMTYARYVEITSTWAYDDFATDCQGLCDAYWTYVLGIKTDITADVNYRTWCTDTGPISEITRPYVIGEAVFEESTRTDGYKWKNHVGWVCGFAQDGVPLVLEARGIADGVVVTRMDERAWTYRGLMTKKFDYTEEGGIELIKFEVTTPMHKGQAYRIMQEALNAAGYTDANGKALDPDGCWGAKSQHAFDSMIADYTPEVIMPEPTPVTHTYTLTFDGHVVAEGEIEDK